MLLAIRLHRFQIKGDGLGGTATLLGTFRHGESQITSLLSDREILKL
ncbi:hypothetical protein STRDD10_01650 [Streptococcus sp. DD10]|nr:hypothetical protein STRDD10_01650 [Streptococcus sp. DD10]